MKTFLRTLMLFLSSLSLSSAASPLPLGSGFYKIRILHTNDMHSRFQQVSQTLGKCSSEEVSRALCYGGFARLKTAVQRELDKAKEENITTLFLNAGDNYQGTVWYTAFKWRVVDAFMKMLPIDVMSLGNHEFDDGIEGIVPFINASQIPIVTCNIDSSEEPEFAKTPLLNSTIIERNGKKFGIIGYVTRETEALSKPGKLKLKEEIDCLTFEAKKLKEQKVDFIIALGHSGYKKDMEIAEKVPYLDVVVGGHSHTFLYSGTPPDIETPVETYPIMVKSKDGRKVPVVQAYAYTKYLGKIDVTFNEKGEVVDAIGNPILLNSTIEENPEVVQELEKWSAKFNETWTKPVGHTKVMLDAVDVRFYESNLGNLVTDAFIYHAVKNYSGRYWTQAGIALQQGGGIRTSINVAQSNGTLTMEDIMTALPFYGSVSMVNMSGKILHDALEWSVMRYDKERKIGRGEFLQVSGLKVQFNLNKKAGSRVVSATVRCSNCDIPKYSPLNSTEYYNVLMPTFLLHGGDNFTMFKVHGKEVLQYDTKDTEIVINYIEEIGLVYPGLEGRTEFITPKVSSGVKIKFSYIYLSFGLLLFIVK